MSDEYPGRFSGALRASLAGRLAFVGRAPDEALGVAGAAVWHVTGGGKVTQLRELRDRLRSYLDEPFGWCHSSYEQERQRGRLSRCASDHLAAAMFIKLLAAKGVDGFWPFDRMPLPGVDRRLWSECVYWADALYCRRDANRVRGHVRAVAVGTVAIAELGTRIGRWPVAAQWGLDALRNACRGELADQALHQWKLRDAASILNLWKYTKNGLTPNDEDVLTIMNGALGEWMTTPSLRYREFSSIRKRRKVSPIELARDPIALLGMAADGTLGLALTVMKRRMVDASRRHWAAKREADRAFQFTLSEDRMHDKPRRGRRVGAKELEPEHEIVGFVPSGLGVVLRSTAEPGGPLIFETGGTVAGGFPDDRLRVEPGDYARLFGLVPEKTVAFLHKARLHWHAGRGQTLRSLAEAIGLSVSTLERLFEPLKTGDARRVSMEILRQEKNRPKR